MKYPEPQGRVQRRAAQARHGVDGARRERGLGHTQFFICFADAPFLDRKYTVWGKVVSGMENVDKIKRGEPVREPDKIVKAKLS